MIAQGEVRPLIICSVAYYTPYSGDATKNCKDFYLELTKDIIPCVETAFRTYAETVKPAGIAGSRWHRAFSGFSMGACATWSVFEHCMDAIACYIPISGDCWAIGRGRSVETAKYLADGFAVKGVAPEDFRVYSGCGRHDIAEPNLTPLIREMRKYPAIFKYCDYGIVGDMDEVCDQMLRRLRR